jgi:hypothetical protein
MVPLESRRTYTWSWFWWFPSSICTHPIWCMVMWTGAQNYYCQDSCSIEIRELCVQIFGCVHLALLLVFVWEMTMRKQTLANLDQPNWSARACNIWFVGKHWGRHRKNSHPILDFVFYKTQCIEISFIFCRTKNLHNYNFNQLDVFWHPLHNNLRCD